jgi:hypothetical protein
LFLETCSACFTETVLCLFFVETIFGVDTQTAIARAVHHTTTNNGGKH